MTGQPSATLAGSPPIARFRRDDLTLASVLEAKGRTGAEVHVVIPARDEAATIGPIVSACRTLTGSGEPIGPEAVGRRLPNGCDPCPLVDGLVVVDDASVDDTAAIALDLGARVVAGPGLGKGEAMAAGVDAVRRSLADRAVLATGAVTGADGAADRVIVVFLDADVEGFDGSYVHSLVGPLLAHPEIDLVKGCYRRPLGDQPLGGGRVTELVARPTLQLLWPDLASVEQPLAGETAARLTLLDELDLAFGYSVEIALLLDTYERHGAGAIAQVDLGVRRHRNRPLAALVPQAREVLSAMLERAGVLGGALGAEGDAER